MAATNQLGAGAMIVVQLFVCEICARSSFRLLFGQSMCNKWAPTGDGENQQFNFVTNLNTNVMASALLILPRENDASAGARATLTLLRNGALALFNFVLGFERCDISILGR
ncbi:MAG TPA: hypothetical protein VEI95_03250 [Acidobacteriota bacterium]|nr:hypothetical protein [Acidobacteriota bacterium]